MKRQPNKKPIDRHELETFITRISGLPRPLARRALKAVIEGISEAVLSGRPLAIRGFLRIQTEVQSFSTPFCQTTVTAPRIQAKWALSMRQRLRDAYLQNPEAFTNTADGEE